MTTNYPSGLDTISTTLANAIGAGDARTTAANASAPNATHHSQHNNHSDAIAAIETKLGIDASAVATSIDYLLKNAASANPGHTHSATSLTNIMTTNTAQSVTGAKTFARGDLLDKGTNIFQAEAYGAVGDDSTDNTTFVNNALADIATAGGGVLQFGPGTFRVSSLNSIGTSCMIRGAGHYATKIKTTSATADVVTSTSTIIIEDIGFTSSVTRTAGAYINLNSSINNIIASVILDLYYGGIKLTSAVGTRIYNVLGTNPTGSATSANGYFIDSTSTNDTRVIACTCNYNGVSQPTYGIHIHSCADFEISTSQIIHHGTGLMVDPGAATVVSDINVLESFFDSGTLGMSLSPSNASGSIVRCSFVQCWFGNSSSHGVTIGTTGTVSGVEFVACRFHINGGSGLNIAAGSDIKVQGGTAAQNTSDGITIAASLARIFIQGFSANAYSGLSANSGWGINIGASVTNSVVANCTLLGNTSGQLNNTSPTGVTTMGNVGAQPFVSRAMGAAVGNVVQNTVSDSALFTASLPANSLGANAAHIARVTAVGRWQNNKGSSGTVTLRAKFGGTTFWGDISASITNSAVNVPWMLEMFVFNYGTTAQNYVMGRFALGSLTSPSIGGEGSLQGSALIPPTTFWGSGTVDTTAAQNIVFSCQLSINDVNFFMLCDYYNLELI